MNHTIIGDTPAAYSTGTAMICPPYKRRVRAVTTPKEKTMELTPYTYLDETVVDLEKVQVLPLRQLRRDKILVPGMCDLPIEHLVMENALTDQLAVYGCDDLQHAVEEAAWVSGASLEEWLAQGLNILVEPARPMLFTRHHPDCATPAGCVCGNGPRAWWSWDTRPGMPDALHIQPVCTLPAGQPWVDPWTPWRRGPYGLQVGGTSVASTEGVSAS